MRVVPVVMAGGSGTRLWPLSRSMYPKQFIDLASENSMLQDTALRLKGLNCIEPVVICNEEHRFFVAQQLAELQIKANIILEPVGRNTAPAIALAAMFAKPEDLLLVMAADHVIHDVTEFQRIVRSAVALAEEEFLVTFGVVPHEANTGYGYIKAGEKLGEGFRVEKFVEKPDQKNAEDYLASGQYFWNSGMFLFKAGDFLNELKTYRPDIAEACERAMSEQVKDLDFIRVSKEAFQDCPSDSVDYAVMEKTDKAVMVTLDAGWSDIGSWQTLWEIGEQDLQGNVLRGEVIAQQTQNCYVHAPERLVATLGLDDVVVVDTKDAVLVAAKDTVQDIKQIVEVLKKNGKGHHESHRKVYRPWGWYDSIDAGERFQVKRIHVNPGASLSLQKHFYRAEHWVVVNGTATVICGGKELKIYENESTYIPLGEKHRLSNEELSPLEVVEIQSGSYLGEDDIVRYKDNYGRDID